MTDPADYVAASKAGRAASPGDRNPYAGNVVLARLWMLGYRQMLDTRIADMERRSAESARP